MCATGKPAQTQGFTRVSTWPSLHTTKLSVQCCGRLKQKPRRASITCLRVRHALVCWWGSRGEAHPWPQRISLGTRRGKPSSSGASGLSLRPGGRAESQHSASLVVRDRLCPYRSRSLSFIAVSMGPLSIPTRCSGEGAAQCPQGASDG